MAYSFFAMISRLKFINRWALMRNTQSETLNDHTVQVAFIAHALAVIGNKRLYKDYNADRVAVLALFHDTTEILTGDMPTPIKYKNQIIKDAYKKVETEAAEHLLKMLPQDLREEYFYNFMKKDGEEELWALVKAADKLSAVIKCLEEKKAGNSEFKTAEILNKKQLKALDCEEAEIFVKEFLEAYSCNLDELTTL